MSRVPSVAFLTAALSLAALPAVIAQEVPTGQTPPATPAVEGPKRVPKDAKVFILPAEGFEVYVAAGLVRKKVPVTVVSKRELADFEIATASESQKPGWATVLLTRQTGSREEASVTVTHVGTGTVTFAYAFSRGNTFRGKQSAAESIANHLRDHINGK